MNRTWAYSTLLALLVAAAPGCAVGRWMTSTPEFKQVQVRYRVQGNLVDEKPQPSPVQPAVAGGEPAMVVTPSSDPAKQYVRTIDLVYPYPADSDKALAILRTVGAADSTSVSGTGGFARRPSDEILTLSVRRNDVDAILRELNSEGYFDGQAKSRPGVTLATMLDGNYRTTSWSRIDRLDTLAHRLMARGKRVDPAKVPELVAAMAGPAGNRPGQSPNGAAPGTLNMPATVPPGIPAQRLPSTQPPQQTYPLPEPSSYRQAGAATPHPANVSGGPTMPNTPGNPSPYPVTGGYPHAMPAPNWSQTPVPTAPTAPTAMQGYSTH